MNTTQEPIALKRAKMVNAGKLHWVHWFVLVLSLLLTTSTWMYARNQVSARNQSSFEKEADLVVALVTERMHKYEDALRGGVGAIHLNDRKVDALSWKRFSDTLNIDQKYPGINGIGVIVALEKSEIARFENTHRQVRPDFRVYPDHDEPESLPILTVEPVADNLSAVGLDIAHEPNRYNAAKLARDTATSQITAPIFLVQDQGHTPGFLFYFPFYSVDNPQTVEARRSSFLGMVYAPFVVKKLLEGTLAHSNRHVSLQISDGDQVIYDELSNDHPEYDPDPQFTRELALTLYGRVWHINIQTNHLFRASIDANQHYLILVTGLIIDALLLFLFLALSKSNRKAVAFADEVTLELQRDKKQLERSNLDLEQFAYIASHDLQEPLRMIGNFTQLLQRRYAGKLDDRADEYINYSVDGVSRMQKLLNDLLQYSRVGQEQTKDRIDSHRALQIATTYLSGRIQETGTTLVVDPLPEVLCNEVQMVQLFQNLLSNAIKFSRPDTMPEIRISAEKMDDEWQFTFQDNGIGVEPQFRDQIFVLFRRLHNKDSFPGTGLGLATCKKIVTQHGGRIWLETPICGIGTSVCFTLPATETEKPVRNKRKNAATKSTEEGIVAA